MDITEISILHHACIVLLGLWLLSAFNCCHPVAYFGALIYLYLVHERYVTRLRRKLQFEERKQANQRRVLSDSESVRWLNHAVENIWPICMEQIVSQKILLPIVPWFLEKYKPWTAKKAMVQHLYLGRNPPLFTDMRVLRQNNDDHLVLELGMNFLTADDMSAIIAVKLRKRLGFGMWAKLHITGMHVEGKVLVGVRFRQTWPFLSRLRVCFVEPPYFQMTVKPIFTHGLDVTEVPGIAGWLDKLLSIAFEQTLVEPNMLVVDVEKFASPQPEPWFSINEKEPVAYAYVEVVEGSDMKPSDLNGLADPYVKGHSGGYRFRTKIQKKTLNPKWLEEFKIPIVTWECANVLAIEVCDKDHFYDDNLGSCSVNLGDLRDGQRHDMWLPLQNIKTGRLHLAITILEDNAKEVDKTCNKEAMDAEQERNSFANEAYNKSSFSSVSSEKSQKVADNYEPIDVEGQKETGIWVHQPGSEVSQTWEPRKGRSRRLDTEIHREPNDLCGSFNSAASGSSNNDCSSHDDNPEDKHRIKSIMNGLHKIGSVFQRGPKNEPPTPTSARSVGEAVPPPHANISAENAKKIGVHFVMEDNISEFASGKVQIEGTSPESNGSESAGKGNAKDKAKNVLKHAAGKSARGLKHVLSHKSRKSQVDSPGVQETRILEESDSSDDDSLSVQSPSDGRIPVASKVIVSFNNDPFNSSENVVQTRSPDATLGNEVLTKEPDVEEESAKHGSPDKSSKDYVETKHDSVSGGTEQI
ncbi:C2 domain-containing protein At1g53590-like [Neltuma alba]|uniref:C2 domain-containing protein At1g53590-like n=1 Tax=Neltuma alba TaxID=207710 RepID=UPI0010A49795|nr:C2 domain-containing protein At1g53590-like [Prosopis alba]